MSLWHQKLKEKFYTLEFPLHELFYIVASREKSNISHLQLIIKARALLMGPVLLAHWNEVGALLGLGPPILVLNVGRHSLSQKSSYQQHVLYFEKYFMF